MSKRSDSLPVTAAWSVRAVTAAWSVRAVTSCVVSEGWRKAAQRPIENGEDDDDGR